MEGENMSFIDVRDMVLKWSTKAEEYKALTITGNIYIPLVDQINSDYIRDILWRDKQVIKLSDILVCLMR